MNREAGTLDTAAFRTAMSRFPSGVTIVTTTDGEGRPWGFTATAFSSLSLEPPLVLVCLAKTARCHAAFARAERYVISILAPEHRDLALRFASKDDDKFSGGPFRLDAEHGHPVLGDAAVRLDCTISELIEGGDHTVLIGRVDHVVVRDVEPIVHYDRRFHRVVAD